MKLLRNKMPAFSLLEMLVVLVISSIAVGIIYSSYEFSARYHIRIGTKTDRNLAVQELYMLLMNDFDRSLLATKPDSSTVFIFFPEQRKNVKYSFYRDSVVRIQAERRDKFDGLFSKPEFEMIQADSVSPPVVKSIRLGVSSFHPPLVFFYNKAFDAAALLPLPKQPGS
jgi:prepilin-type N-terminal cleavage/methylation domain-containing protein